MQQFIGPTLLASNEAQPRRKPGKVGTAAPEDARDRCQKVLGNVAHGRHPLLGLGGTDGITLGMFIADTYTTWVKASRPRTAANTLEKLHRLFRT